MRPPRRLQELRAAVGVGADRLEHDTGAQPTAAELARALGVETADVEAARECSAGYTVLSLDGPGTAGGVQDAVAPESSARDRFDTSAALGALRDLPVRELELLHLRFVDERTQAETGAVIGVSQMQVSRLLSAVLDRLRETLLEADRAA